MHSPGGSWITCRVLSGRDLHHLYEIFEEKVYGSRFDGMTVVDVGMSNGDSLGFFLERGASRVIGIEPLESSYRIACQNAVANEWGDRASLLNAALSDKDGEVTMQVPRDLPNSASLAVTSDPSEGGHSVHVRARTLSSVMAEAGDQRIGLLKLDCEGEEYSILHTLPKSCWRLIDEIHLEYHAGVQDLAELLELNGFQVSRSGGTPVGYLRASRTSPIAPPQTSG